MKRNRHIRSNAYLVASGVFFVAMGIPIFLGEPVQVAMLCIAGAAWALALQIATKKVVTPLRVTLTVILLLLAGTLSYPLLGLVSVALAFLYIGLILLTSASFLPEMISLPRLLLYINCSVGALLITGFLLVRFA